MTRIKGQSGQSVYDMAMICYGSLSMLIPLLRDSGIDDLSDLSADGKVFIFDETQNQTLGRANRGGLAGFGGGSSLDTVFTQPNGRAFSNAFSNGFS